jgi:hypothetical protein
MKIFDFDFSGDSRKIFEAILKYIKDWCSTHQWAIGIAEMAAGAAIINWGVQTGAIELGKHAVATELSNKVSLAGGAAGGSLGMLVGTMVGSIGVAGMGGAIGIPAIAMIGGGALLLGAAGYTSSNLAYKFTQTPIDYSSSLKGASLITLGTVLIVDGAKRFLADKKVKKLAVSFKDWILHLPELTVKVVADSLDKLKRLIDEIAALPEDKIDALGNAASIASGAMAGTAIGGSMAAASVTVFGSSSLGSIALALGLVSPPVWPVIAVGIAGGATAHIFWKVCKGWGNESGTTGA